MNQIKIEKFTDKLFLKAKTNQSLKKSLTSRSQKASYNSSHRSSAVQPQSINRQLFRQQKQKQGLTKTDIDKLQLMCADLNAEDYLNKLILIHQEQNAARCQEQLQITNTNLWNQPSYDDFFQLNEQSSSNALKIKSLENKDQIKQYCSPKNTRKISRDSNNQKIIKQGQKSKQKKYQGNKIEDNHAPLIDKKNSFVFVNKLPKPEKKIQKNIINSQRKEVIQKINLQQTNNFDQNANNYENDKYNLGSTIESDSNFKQLNLKEHFNSKETKEGKYYEDKNFLDLKQPVTQLKQMGEGLGRTMKKQLQQNEHEEKQWDEALDAKNLQEICYVEIGKRMVNVTQKQIRRQFFKTNLHIRSYLMRNIVEYIKYLAEYSPDSIFILPNERALHFEPNIKPSELDQYLEHTKYVQIIRNVNHIIQKNIFKQKYFQKEPDYWPFFMLGMFMLLIIMLILVVFVGDDAEMKNIFMVCTGLLICILLVVLIGYSLSCYRQETKFRPVCQVIYEDIDSYFKFINGKMENDIEWITGESFFWIQIKIRNNNNPINVIKNGKLGRTRNRYYLRPNLMQQSSVQV